MEKIAEPLFRALLGPSYDQLPPSVQRLHARGGQRIYHGKVEVERGRGWLSRLCARATRLPPAGRGPIRVDIVVDDGRELWVRYFAGHAMRSRLWARNGLLCERLGLVEFRFRLQIEDREIHWRIVRVSALGLPMPIRWFERAHAREYERDGRYRFDVAATLPRVGLLVHYKGWLDVD